MAESIKIKIVSQKNILSKSNRLEARVSFEQKKLFQQASDLLGRSLTDFIIVTLQEEALRIIQEHKVLKLVDQDRELFLQLLLNPPSPNENLTKAAQRYFNKVTNSELSSQI
jgi:uncharacterized protein (DUF1778 family)